METSTSPVAIPEFVGKLADSVNQASTLEELVRPLLELLQTVTGMESTYLTTIDLEAGLQHVLYARNTRRMRIDEGLTVPWGDTLCRRALEEQRTFTDDVGSCWGDSAAAAELGIATYVSTQVRTCDGALYGTLCAASDERKPQPPGAAAVLEMFSRLIAQQVDRERLMRDLRQANATLSLSARTDATTRLPNRRALMEELQARLARIDASSALLVLFIDLDGFKAINDTHGHEAGDRFLVAIGERLRGALREGDFAGRLGGDEFLVLSSVRREELDSATKAITERMQAVIAGHYAMGQVALDYAGASIGVAAAGPGETDAEAVLARADAAMYAVKRQRKGLSRMEAEGIGRA